MVIKYNEIPVTNHCCPAEYMPTFWRLSLPHSLGIDLSNTYTNVQQSSVFFALSKRQ